MNSIQRIAKNIGMSFISQIIVSIFGFLLLIYIARFLGEAEFGIYSFAVSFTSLFIVLADIGISQLIIREIARDKKRTNEFIINASILKIILSSITLGLIALIINLMNYPYFVIYIVYLFGIYTILSSFSQMLMSVFQAFEKMEYFAAITSIEKIIIISFGLYALFLGYGLTTLAYVYVFSSIITFFISLFVFLKKFVKLNSLNTQKINLSLWKTLTADAAPFGFNTLFGMLFFKIDTVLLSFLKNDIAVGVYNAAYNPLLALGTVLTGMTVNAIYPVMSKKFTQSELSIGVFTTLSSKYMFILGIPISMGCLILANRFIELFYGNQFNNAVLSFQILALFMPLRLVSSITGTHLTSINKQEIRTFIVFLSSIFNIILNLLLIPYFSFIGASIATVISEIFLYFGFLISLNKYYGKLNLSKFTLKPLLGSIVMGIFLLFFQQNNIFLITICGTFIYIFVLIIIKTFDENDKNIYRTIFYKQN